MSKLRASKVLFALWALAAALCACADDTDGARVGGTSGAFGIAADPPPGTARWLAAVGGDYKTTALSIIDLASLGPADVHSAPAVHSAALHSGSALVASSMALSGDVVLAQAELPERHVLLVDRTHGALAEYDVAAAKVTRQISVATGFYANPQDVAVLDDDRWLVARMGKNPNPTPTLEDYDEGDDLLVIHPADGTIAARLDLAGFAANLGQRAAPQRMARLDKRIWVLLAEFASDLKSQSTARLIAVGASEPYPMSDFSLAPWRNCVSLRVAGPGRLVAACQGSFQMPEQQLQQSALLLVDIADGKAQIVATAPAAEGLGPWSRDVAVLDGRWVVGIVLGDFGTGRPDRAWLVDMASGQRRVLADAAVPFGYSGLWADPQRGTVWLGEAARNGGDLLRFLVTPAGDVGTGVPVSSNPGGLGALELLGR